MKMAVVVYQAGIANVFRIQSMLDLTGRERLLQGTFDQCEQFARGLACAGVIVRSMYCNVAGDCAERVWNWLDAMDAPFKDARHPVCVTHPSSWPDASEWKTITLDDGTVDGKRIAYTSATDFLVQVGKGRGSYKTRNRVVGNLSQAVALYRAINIGDGYKKRLLMPSCSKNPVIAKQAS
jgi:hypothetical protein